MKEASKVQELEQRIKRLENALLLTQTEKFNLVWVFCRLDVIARVLELDVKEIEERVNMGLKEC